jgi:protein CpxP
MTKFLILLTALAASASTSFAQAPARAAQTAVDPAGQPKSPDQQAERRAQYLTKELGLTPDQQARLTPILLAQRQEMQTLRSQVQTGGRRVGMGQDLKASQTKYDTQIKAVLTPEQYAKFGQLKAEQRDKLRERRASGQGFKRAE